jgi:predicted transcriptional regulator
LYIAQYLVSDDTTLKEEAILQTLVKGEMSFQDLVDKCFPNRNKGRERLDALIKRGLIQEDRENWRRGQRLFFSLTPKGEISCLKDEVDKIEKNMEIVDSLFTILEKKGFEKFYEGMRERSPPIHVSGQFGRDFPVDNYNEIIKKEITQALKELKESFGNFQLKLHTQTSGANTTGQ